MMGLVSTRRMAALKISEVAERGGVNLQTIRYYEREGLLPEPPRLASGYRVFPELAVRRVRFIKRAQELGFSLAEIRELLTLRVDHQRDRAAVRAIARAKLSQIDEKIRSLEIMKQALEHLTDKCTGHGPASECPILEALDLQDELV
jgi:MerR family transcriptional regulator, copper efflux regulator